MDRAFAGFELVDELGQRRDAADLALGDRLVDARQILQDHAAGAEIGVADLGIAHLPVRQADIMLARLEPRMRPAAQELVPDRRLRLVDRVVVAILALAPAVEDAQYQRARSGSHRSQTLAVRANVGEVVYANAGGWR